ncbi:Pyruvate dehydrogenase (Acetyl-transferring) E1 component subunit alpha OS=Streptomyces tendae OX=1932 GN=pdhA PE=4 SV=1 [Streptomyces tendae]
MTVESTAARTPRRSAGNKAGTTGTKRTTSTTKKAAGADKSAEPALVQLLTPEGKRVKNAEFDTYVADITAEDLRGLYRDMVLTRRFDAEATALQRRASWACGPRCSGQEAAQIGSGRALRDDDYVFPTYVSTASPGAAGWTQVVRPAW